MTRLAAAILLLALRPCAAQDEASRYFYEDIHAPFLAPDLARAGWVKSARPGAAPLAFPARKQEGVFRVVLVGGSIARMQKGMPDSGSIEAALQAVLPARRVELLNCGMSGYDSARELGVVRELMGYSPDLLVLMTGHNESPGRAPAPLWQLKLRRLLDRSAVFRSLAAGLRGRPPTRAQAAAAAIRDFEENLKTMLRSAREAGAAAVVLAPPLNLREAPPVSEPPADEYFARGALRLLRRDWAGAEKAFRTVLEGGRLADPEARALALSRLARAQEGAGDLAGAARSLEEASELQYRSMARPCGASCREIIRRAAAEGGAAVADADRAFRAAAAPRLPGLDLFDDGMHWKPRLNALVSASIAEAALSAPALASLPWRPEGLAAFRAAATAAREQDRDELKTLRYALAALPENSFSPAAAALLSAAYRGNPTLFARPADVLEKTGAEPGIGAAWGQEPARPSESALLRHLAQVQLELGRPASARASLERALALEPGRAELRLSLAEAQALTGARAEASRTLAKLLAEARTPERRERLRLPARWISEELELGALAEPRDGLYWLVQGAESAAAGRRDEALARLERSERGADAPLRSRIARVKSQLFTPTPASPPPDQDPRRAQYWLRQAHEAAASGRRAEALAALGKSEGLLDPAAPELGAAAELRCRLGDCGGAARLYRRALAAQPGSLELWQGLASAVFRSESPSLAAPALAKAWALAKTRDQRLALALRIQSDAGPLPALPLLESLARENPRDAEVLAARGICEQLAARPQAALASLEAALALDPAQEQAALSLGALYSASGRGGEALAVYERALERRDGSLREELLRRRDALARAGLDPRPGAEKTPPR